jgi:hypothetical protein
MIAAPRGRRPGSLVQDKDKEPQIIGFNICGADVRRIFPVPFRPRLHPPSGGRLRR